MAFEIKIEFEDVMSNVSNISANNNAIQTDKLSLDMTSDSRGIEKFISEFEDFNNIITEYKQLMLNDIENIGNSVEEIKGIDSFLGNGIKFSPINNLNK